MEPLTLIMVALVASTAKAAVMLHPILIKG